MKNNIFYLLTFLLLAFSSCSSNDDPINNNPEPEVKDGFNFSMTELNADEEVVVTFVAGKTSALYGYSGDVYLHAGVIVEGSWMYVPADWDENLPKCKLTKVSDNRWKMTLSPSIRSWFNSGTSPVTQLGLIVRSEDGKKKGLENDFFVSVKDDKYESFVPAKPIVKSMPSDLVEGINIISSSKVTLVLYDKDKDGSHKDFAYAIGDFNNWILANNTSSQMYRDNDKNCWWISYDNLDSSKEYRFQYYVGNNDGEIVRLADAYAEKVLDPDNDKYIPSTTYPESTAYPEKGRGIVSVFKTDMKKYSWEVQNFEIKDQTDLVIYELHFRDFTSTSDINGAFNRLDYLQSMGVNAIELMPIQEFDGNDSWGYNPCFYFATDKAYGTKEMYQSFIDECHKRGMAVILDVVYNHATGNHPFAKLYWDNAKSRTAESNPWFNVEATHPYSVFHDFNHDSPLVRAFVKRNLKFLMDEYKIDGFRFDLSKGFTQNKSNDDSSFSRRDDDRIAILKDYNSFIKSVNSKTMVILEHLADYEEEKILADSGMFLWRNMNYSYCESAMGWPDHSDFSGLYTSQGHWVGYMESHDEERMSFKQKEYGNYTFKTNLEDRMSQLEVNTAFFLMVPGPKMIWQFGELGYDYSIEYNGRTGRKPVKWEYYDNEYRRALYDTYAKLMKLRNDNEELFDITSNFSWKVKGNFNWNTGRFLSLGNSVKQVVVAGNFTDTKNSYSVDFPVQGNWKEYISGDNLSVTGSSQSIEVNPHSFKVFINFEAN